MLGLSAVSLLGPFGLEIWLPLEGEFRDSSPGEEPYNPEGFVLVTVTVYGLSWFLLELQLPVLFGALLAAVLFIVQQKAQ